MFAITIRKITKVKDFTFLSSPNLKLAFDGQISIPFSVHSEVRFEILKPNLTGYSFAACCVNHDRFESLCNKNF